MAKRKIAWSDDHRSKIFDQKLEAWGDYLGREEETSQLCLEIINWVFTLTLKICFEKFSDRLAWILEELSFIQPWVSEYLPETGSGGLQQGI